MALETSGFQLSQLESAPQIPGNIGVVDTKSIYGAVVDALKANEALRTTQAAQAATDAELALAQRKAQTEMGLLGPEAEARKAKAQLFTAGAPLEMGLLESRANAERAKLGYETALSGELIKPENIAAAARAKTLSSTARGTYELARMAADPTQPKEVRDAAAIKIQTIQSANQRFKLALDAGKVDFRIPNADGTEYVRFKDGSTGTIGYPETYTGNAAAYLSGPITGSLGAPVSAGAVAPLVPVETEEIPVGAFAPAAPTGAPATATPGAVLSGIGPRAGAVSRATKSGLLAAQSAVKFGGETSPLAGIEGDEVKKEALSTAAEMGKEARKEIRTQLTNLTSFQTEARKEDDVQKELDALIKEANDKGIMISGGGLLGRGARALLPGEAAAFQSRLGSIIQFIQLGNMLKLKNASSTGSTGFGSLTEPENRLLQSDYGDLTKPDLPSESLVAGLERAKRGLALRRQEALDTIRGRLAVERGVEQQTSAFFQNAKDRFVIPRHPLEVQEQAAPTTSGLPSLEGRDLFPSRGNLTPARLTLGSEPTPEPAPSLENMEVLEVDGKPAPESGTVDVGRFKGRVDQPTEAPKTAPAPTETAAQYQYPVYSAFGVVERLTAENRRKQEEIRRNDELLRSAIGNVPENLLRAGEGAIGGLLTGEYRMPEKSGLRRVGESIGEALSGTVGQERDLMRREDEILRSRPNSWEAYDIRRKRGLPKPSETPAPAPAPAPAEPEPVAATETAPAPIRLTSEQISELSQIKLSPESTKTARRLLSEYQAGQKAGRREQPVLEITASDGKRRSFTVENPEIADQLIAILTGQQAPNLEPRLEPDREATRRLGEERMRREEVARQFRTMPRR